MRRLLHEDLHDPFYHVIENTKHASLESSRDIVKTKRCTSVGIGTKWAGESGFFLIL